MIFATLLTLLKFSPLRTAFHLMVWYYKLENHNQYREELCEANYVQKVQSNNDIDHCIIDITHAFFTAADIYISNTFVIVKINDSP